MEYGSTSTQGAPLEPMGLKSVPLPSQIVRADEEGCPFVAERASAFVRHERGMKGSILAATFIEQMGEEKSKEQARFLAQGVGMQILAFFSFVCFSGITPLLLRQTYQQRADGSKGPAYIQTMPFVGDFFISIVVGSSIAAFTGGVTGLKGAWDPWAILTFMPIMALSAPSEMLQSQIMKYMASTAWRMMKQMKLPMTALCVRFILGRKGLTSTQWVLIASVCTGILGYGVVMNQQQATPGAGGDFSLTGVMWALLSICLTSVSGVFGDVAYKKVKHPIYAQLCQGRLTSFVIGLTCTCLIVHFDGKWDLFPFGNYTLGVALLSPWLALKDWCGSYVLKHLDSIWKALAGVLSIAVSYFLDFTFEKKRHGIVPPIFILVTMINILAYALAKRDQANAEKAQKA